MFLRIAYVSVMSPFAPQIFIWMNAAFLGICLLLQVLAALLPSRTPSPFHPSESPAWNEPTKST